MKFLQLNTWMGRLTHKIVPFLQAENADIVTLQEVFQSDDEVIYPDRMFNCLREFQTAGQYEYLYFSPVWSMDAGHRQVDFGNAILSSFPIVSAETTFTNNDYNPDLTPETRRDNTRNMQVAMLDVNGSKLHVVNHHAHWIKSPVGDEMSAEKMHLVAEKVRELQGPIIVAGDLNVTASSPAMRTFDGWLTDLTATHNIGDTLSELGKVRNVPCDHILVNEQVKVSSFAVRDDLVSDHKALVMEFEL